MYDDLTTTGAAVELLNIDHYTLRVEASQLPALLEFYTRVLSLEEGPRPDFAFPGHWLYAGAAAVVHLAGNQPPGEPAPPAAAPTGRFNHVSLRSRGLAAARARLAARGIEWQEAPVPGAPLHQIFLRDPCGLQIELTFDAAEVADAAR